MGDPETVPPDLPPSAPDLPVPGQPSDPELPDPRPDTVPIPVQDPERIPPGTVTPPIES